MVQLQPPHRRILLVEDSIDFQRLATRQLEQAGFDVTVAENGRLGLELALASIEAKQPFAAVLMDLDLPVLDGLAATRSLRSNGFSAPIIAVSARSSLREIQACYDAGCASFVAKPVRWKELIDRIEAHAGNYQSA